MRTKLDGWTSIATAVLVVTSLLACKKFMGKEEDEAPEPVASAAAPAPVKVEEEPKEEKAPEAKDTVKRYPDKEIEEKGTVRVTVNLAKLYKEADATTEHIARLQAGTLVNKKARMGNWTLIEYPTGVGVLSPAWILSKHISSRVVPNVKPEEVAKQTEGVELTDAGKAVAEAEKAKDDATKVAEAVADAGAKVAEEVAKIVDAGAATADGGSTTVPILRIDGGFPNIKPKFEVTPK